MNLGENWLGPLIEYRRLAERARCHVKRWHLTDDQAWQLAFALAWAKREGPFAIYEALRSGESHILGASVRVKMKRFEYQQFKRELPE